MVTIPHEPSGVDQDRQRWSLQLLVPEMWASLAIVVMWLAVLFDAIYGPDIVSSKRAGLGAETSISVPSVVAVALFAFLGTWVVARYGFGHGRKPRASATPPPLPGEQEQPGNDDHREGQGPYPADVREAQ